MGIFIYSVFKVIVIHQFCFYWDKNQQGPMPARNTLTLFCALLNISNFNKNLYMNEVQFITSILTL